VCGEIIRRFGRPARFQICRAGADHTDGFADPHRDQAAVGESANGDADVHVLFRQIDRPILEDEMNVDLRERREELG